MSDYIERIEQVAAGIVRENALRVDGGNFPQTTVDALAQAGLLGLISSTEVGGMGEGPRAAATVVERLARECASSAMVACMHYSGTAVIEQYGDTETRKNRAGSTKPNFWRGKASEKCLVKRSRTSIWSQVSKVAAAHFATQASSKKTTTKNSDFGLWAALGLKSVFGLSRDEK